jgi:hypothetical protein
MPRTWSNRKVTDYVSPATRAKNRPNSLNTFTVIIILVVVFFLGLMGTVMYTAMAHPPHESKLPTAQNP